MIKIKFARWAAMKYRYLGETGVQVSESRFGTMSFGGDSDAANARAMFHRCREMGKNLFGYANGYAGGRSEELLGEFIADCRDGAIITGTFYFPTGRDINTQGASRRHMKAAAEARPKQQKCGYIDVHFVHRFDDRTPLEETRRGLDDLARQGKTPYTAASNSAAWEVAQGLGISAKEG